jgi:hypothetical protein
LKRFTETTKWRDPWFRKLSPLAKLLWSYIDDHCNSAGIIELDMEAAAFDIGKIGEESVSEKHLEELMSRISKNPSNCKLLVRKFIYFQCGTLTQTCPAHKPTISLVEQFGLVKDGVSYDWPGMVNAKEPEIQQEKPPPACRFTKPDAEELKLESAKIGLPAGELVKFVNYYESNGWKVGRNPMKSWRHALANWNVNYRSRTHEHKTSQSTGRTITGPDRNAGTANAQTIGQYDGVGKMVPVRDGGNS